MTIQDIITDVDRLVPNSYSIEDKIKWISTVDYMFKRDVLDYYRQNPGDFMFFVEPYNKETPLDTTVLIPEPYASEIYTAFVEAKIHLYNHDINHYNNAITDFTDKYEVFCNKYRTTHRRKTNPKFKIL